MLTQSVCMLEVHVKEERVATCLKTSSCVGHIELSMLAAKKAAKGCACVRAHAYQYAHKKHNFTQQQEHTQTQGANEADEE